MTGLLMGWQFRLLGPLEVRRDEALLVVGSAKQRTLLAALLLEPNTVVGLDRLIDALWETAVPRSAIANVRTYASRLRSMLTDSHGFSPMQSKASGYII